MNKKIVFGKIDREMNAELAVFTSELKNVPTVGIGLRYLSPVTGEMAEGLTVDIYINELPDIVRSFQAAIRKFTHVKLVEMPESETTKAGGKRS